MRETALECLEAIISELRDVTNIGHNMKCYGGLSCQKRGITIDSIDYLLKFPDNLKVKQLKNVDLSYSNSPLCEYIGSHIFKMLDIPVHKTELVKCNGKLCVLCEDFETLGRRLYEFRELKATFEKPFLDESGNESDGTGSKLSEALLVVREHHMFKQVPNCEERFWQMFIVDAIIGNKDRNDSNWGVLVKDNFVELAPIYGNGNSLCNKWSEERMAKTIEESGLLEDIAYNSGYCWFTKDNGKPINAFHLIESNKYPKCTSQLKVILEKVDSDKIYGFIDSIQILTKTQKTFYKSLLTTRIQELKRIYESITKEQLMCVGL